MSDYTAQRDRIAAIIVGVTGVGRVHDHPRFGSWEDLYFTVPTAGGLTVAQMRAWEIGLEYQGETITTRREQSFRHRRIPWRVQAYYQLYDDEPAGPASDRPGSASDATYPVLVDHLLSVADAIDADRSLAGSCNWIDDPATVGAPDTISLLGPICWTAAITFTTVTIKSP